MKSMTGRPMLHALGKTTSSHPLSNRRPAIAATERHVVAFVAHRSLAGKCTFSLLHMKKETVQMTGP
jgi:hypothetical protein